MALPDFNDKGKLPEGIHIWSGKEFVGKGSGLSLGSFFTLQIQ
jgi:hypothetical protein